MPTTVSISAAGSSRGRPAAAARRYTSHTHSRTRARLTAVARSGPVVTAPWFAIRQAERPASAVTTLAASSSVP
ncbi:MAG TPA: hypothetical protein VG268_18870 [Streptosporangiaceae bacterium]|nr:hypothetical protein [Streptosporangiaceae bacterium]